MLFELLCCAVVTLSKDSVVTPISIIKLLLFPIMIVIYIIIYNKFKNQKVFMSAGSAVMIISYIAIVLSTNRTYMYAFIFLVFYYVMIYMDKDFMFRGVIGSSITNIILTIKFILTVEGSSSVVIIQCMFALFGAIACYNCVAISSRHNHETMDAIEENAKNEASLNEKLSNLSDDLANKFEIAKENAKVMTNNMESSNNSVAEISESIKMTAMAIEKQTELTSNIQNNLEETEKHTKEMHEAADASATAVKSGKEAMTLLSNQAVLTGELNQRSQKSTEELSERIHDVESFTSEILSISNQTNLLALNASIEAARAGDAGKGFAVVAEEIRQLSDQTKNSVNKITEIISRLVENSNEASESMSQSIIASEKQNKMIDDVISNIDMIEEKNVVLLSLMNNIATEIVKILEDNTQINDSISNLSAMSEEVAASSESSMHVIAESMNSVSNLNSLLGEIYNISQEMSKLTK